MATKTSRTRKTTTERKALIIAATINCLKAHGLDGASVRKISAEAGISVGLINHHFENKEELIAESYKCVADRNLHSLQQFSNTHTEPRKIIGAFLHQLFHETSADELNIWMSFWRMAEHSIKIRAVHENTNQAFRSALEELLTKLCKEHHLAQFNTRLAAFGMSALIDGLWLEYCLNPTSFSPEEAVSLCETWINTLLTIKGLSGP